MLVNIFWMSRFCSLRFLINLLNAAQAINIHNKLKYGKHFILFEYIYITNAFMVIL